MVLPDWCHCGKAFSDIHTGVRACLLVRGACIRASGSDVVAMALSLTMMRRSAHVPALVFYRAAGHEVQAGCAWSGILTPATDTSNTWEAAAYLQAYVGM